MNKEDFGENFVNKEDFGENFVNKDDYVENFVNKEGYVENFVNKEGYVENFANEDRADEDYAEGLARTEGPDYLRGLLRPGPGHPRPWEKEFGEISLVTADAAPGAAVGPGQTEDHPVAAREPTLVGGKWRASLAAAQQRDT